MKIRPKNKGKGSEQTVTVPCKKCDECQSMKVRHWTGRILAECQSGAVPWFMTFTYKGGYNDPKAYWLDYTDIQKMFKKIRVAGYKFRYVVVGEYGSEKDRAHWHAIILWEGEPPPVTFAHKQYTWDYWSHGYTYAETPRNIQATAQYLMKYLLKDATAPIHYSKRPAIGEKYLHEYARQHVKEGLSLFPTKATFTVPGNTNRDGKPFYYYIDRHSDLFARVVKTYLNEWAQRRPYEKVPLNKNIEEYIEEVLQGPVDPDDALDDFLLAQYEAENPLPDPGYTVHSLENGFYLVLSDLWAVIEKRRGGKPIWRKTVVSPKRNHRSLGNELRQRCLEIIETAPGFVQRVHASEMPLPPLVTNRNKQQTNNKQNPQPKTPRYAPQQQPEGGPGENNLPPPKQKAANEKQYRGNL